MLLCCTPAQAVEVTKLNTKHRGILARFINIGCYRKAKTDPMFSKAPKPAEAAEQYCLCVSGPAADAITLDFVKEFSKTRQVPESFRQSLSGAATACYNNVMPKPQPQPEIIYF